MPTTQIPICIPGPLLPLLPSEVEPEDACAFIIVVVRDNENRLIPTTKNKNINMALLSLFILFFVIGMAIKLANAVMSTAILCV